MNLLAVIESLRRKCPIFHSEADFQFALAWKIHQEYSDVEIRLEVSCNTSIKGRVDIVVQFNGTVFPIELKYLKKKLLFQVNGEQFSLVDGAHDIDMHDCIKDIARLETFQSQMNGFTAGCAVWLTNDAAYWNPEYNASYYSAFHTPQGEVKTGAMAYAAGAKLNSNIEYGSPITLSGSYDVHWND